METDHKGGYDRNYWALTLEGASFMGGIAVMATGGSVALFINAMTGSKTLVGLAATVQTLFLLIGQLSVAPYVRTIRNLPKYLFKTVAIQRIIPLLMALPLFLGLASNWAVGIFLVLFGIFWYLDGFVSVPWGELCARTLKPELRGHMMGLQVTFGGIASLLTGLLLTWLLSTPALDDHRRFGMVFSLASAVLLTSLISMRLIRDPNPIKKPEKLHAREYYTRIPSIIKKSKPLQRALLARMPAYFGFSAVTFIVVFGAGTLNLSQTQVSWLVYANVVGGLIGGVLLGEVSRRLGNKAIILLCNSGALITLGMAVFLSFFPSLGYGWLFATCALASMMQSNWVGYFNYFLDIAPAEERSVFQVIGNCIGIPFSFVGYAMGAMIDAFGFVTAFAVAGGFACLAIVLSSRLLSRRSVQALQSS